MKSTASRPARDIPNNSLHILVLDGATLKKLSSEPNSSKFAIDAHNRGINEIVDLSELPKLCSLDVSFNRLQSLRNVNTGKELRELKAYNNTISSLRGLKGNGNLEGLLVHENQIEEISEDLLALVKLKTLWLNGNRLSKVQCLSSCRMLVHLDLSRNRLSGPAAEGLESLSSLESLNLSGNQISSIGNLTHLTKLEELNLSSNCLASLEGGLLPANVSVLRLNDNKLTSLHSFPPYLTKLNELYLQDNTVVELGDSASKFPELESLDLRNNRIRSVAQLQSNLTGWSALADLWIEGNPCCLSTTYLLDVFKALPELKTLDNMTDAQLRAQMDALKNGVISQEALLATLARPMTPSSSRPGSASSSRPMTPSSAGVSRPATPDRGAPVFHKQSARAGALLKIASPQELERAHAAVAERLEKMKAMLGRVGKADTDSYVVATKTHRRSEMKQPSQTNLSAETGTTSNQEREIHRAAAASRERPRSRGVDAGTDPLDSLLGNNELVRVTLSPEIITPRRGMETQTPREPVVVLPPAPMAVSSSTLPLTTSKSSLADAAAMTDNQTSTKGEERQADGETIEREMRQLLTEYAKQVDPKIRGGSLAAEPQDTEGDDGASEDSESPRITSNKTAELRQPPNLLSRQGYRSFRVPARLRESDQSIP